MSSVNVSQWAVRLACSLIKAQHGEVTEAVCRHLATRGMQTLPEVIRGSGLLAAQVKQALLLLIQHNFVAVYTHKDEDSRVPKPPVALYRIQLEEILQILRRPRFLLHIVEEQGNQAEQIIELLLENGRLSFDQLVKAVAGRQGVAETQVREQMRNVLMSLVNFRYIERAPPCTLPPPVVRLHPNAVKVKRGSKGGSASHAAEQAQVLRGLDEMKYDHMRFKLPNDLILAGALGEGEEDGDGGGGGSGGGAGSGGGRKRTREEDGDDDGVKEEVKEEEGEEDKAGDDMEEEGPAAGGKGGRGRGGRGRGRGGGRAGRGDGQPPEKKQKIKAGTKRAEASPTGEGAAAALKAQAVAEASAMVASQDGANQVLWRINTEEFNRRFRHQMCVEMARDKFDQDTADVLEAMLAAGRVYETQVREERGSHLSHEEVSSHLRRIKTARAKARAADALEARKAEEAAAAAEAGAGAMDAEEGEGAAAAAGGGAGAAAGAGADGAGSGGEEGELGGLDDEQAYELAVELDALCARVPEIIQALCNDPMEFVSYVGEGPLGSTYCVNMVRFLDNLRLKQLEAVARERFGAGGLRIFRMLCLRGQLEQKQVADFAMLPPKDTREVLYLMLKAGFVFLQDIPKTSDRAPSRTFYTWRAEWSATAERFGAELYRAAGNAWARSQHELSTCKELVDMLEAAQAAQKSNFSLTAAQRQQLTRLKLSANLLEVCLMHMDETIALFNAY